MFCPNDPDISDSRFCVEGSAKDALDPDKIPSRIMLLPSMAVPPCRTEELLRDEFGSLSLQAPRKIVISCPVKPNGPALMKMQSPDTSSGSYRTKENGGQHLELFEWTSATVYKTALMRFIWLADMAFSVLSVYRYQKYTNISLNHYKDK